MDDLKIDFNLAYGRLNILKIFSISQSKFNCQGDVNLLDENPIYYFNCSMNSDDKKRLLKKFEVQYKNKDEPIDLEMKGNLNILNNKVNFDLIKVNYNYDATQEDLKFFNNFVGILSSSVIKLILKNGFNSIDPKLSKDKSLFLYIKLFTFKEDVS